MDSIIKDIRYGLRGLLKHPGFTAIVVITLALGIGASTAIFSVVDSVLLRRLPYRTADRIVAIQELDVNGKRVQVTSANFFDVFGIKPQHGRLFIPQDEQAGHAPIAVISNTLWQRRFGSDPAIAGKPITLDGRNYTFAGVAPAGVFYPVNTQVLLPRLRL